jgi:5-methyltetrahydrofolate corrinoid/iron sulfur protein methyltransferase
MLLIADNIHGLNPVVSDAMQRLDPKPIQQLARQCVKNGADLIDLNPGYLSRSNEDRFVLMVEAVQDAVTVPLMLDSPNSRLLGKGLAVCTRPPILDAFSLEEDKLQEILPLAVEHGTDLVALLMDHQSRTPRTADGKLAIAIELRERASAAGLPPERLIFDPVVPSLSWQDSFFQLGEVVRCVRLLASGALFGEPARTMAGLSNLRSGMRTRFPVSYDTTALDLLAGAGLDYALADALHPPIPETFRSIRRIL